MNEAEKQELLRYFKMNFFKSRVEKVHDHLLSLDMQEVNVLQQDFVDLVAEIVKKTE